MRRVATRLGLTILLLATAPLVGCGGDRTERGLAPPDETAAPVSEKELEMPAQERQQQVQQQEQGQEIQNFDEAEGDEEE